MPARTWDKGKADSCFINGNGIHSCKFQGFSPIIQQADGATFYLLKACNSFQKFLLTASGNTGNTQDLSCIYRQINVIQCLYTIFISAVQTFDHQSFLYILWLWTFNIQINTGTYHHL